MTTIIRLQRFALALIAVLPAIVCAQTQSDDELLSRGEYVFKVSGCEHCHTSEDGDELAGGHALETPFGTFYTPNITPHKTAGIGGWTAKEFQQSLHLGIAPDGSHYFPAFPYTSYTRINEQDALAMFKYIQSLPPSDQANRSHDLPWFLQWRLAAGAWKWLFFEPGDFEQQTSKSPQWNRGAYLVEAMGHCAECHTPRNIFGGLNTDMQYAGNPKGPDDELVPNITSDRKTGIGDWSHGALESFLKYGELPNGEYTAGSMEPVVLSLQNLTADDLQALITYLRALPTIENNVSQ
jgi:mono/diheme cytochrome c family protein